MFTSLHPFLYLYTHPYTLSITILYHSKTIQLAIIIRYGVGCRDKKILVEKKNREKDFFINNIKENIKYPIHLHPSSPYIALKYHYFYIRISKSHQVYFVKHRTIKKEDVFNLSQPVTLPVTLPVTKNNQYNVLLQSYITIQIICDKCDRCDKLKCKNIKMKIKIKKL